MGDIRYIHAADAHLDAPFRGLTRESARGGLKNALSGATFKALENLTLLCENEKPHFLVLAGDIYNQEEHSVKAQLELRKACQRLKELNIPVFIAHGNHDPLSSRFTQIDWPDNVIIFGPKIESHVIERDGSPLAVVHGISHSRGNESANLARMFKRDPQYDCFQLGVLHCSVEGEKHGDRYAPCSIDDLRASGLDAWALGHCHERRILCGEPFIAYSGNFQGLHINETGERGCCLVTAARHDGSWRCQAQFNRLGPILWDRLALDLENAATLDEVETMLNNFLEDYRSKADPALDGIIVRIRLEGRSALDSTLRKPEALAQYAERLSHFSYGCPPLWIKDIDLATSPARNEDEYLKRNDILGEISRLSKNFLEDEESLLKMAGPALEPLFSHVRLGKAIAPLDSGQIREIFILAERLCQDMLERR